jgi:hypothetical protein
VNRDAGPARLADVLHHVDLAGRRQVTGAQNPERRPQPGADTQLDPRGDPAVHKLELTPGISPPRHEVEPSALPGREAFPECGLMASAPFVAPSLLPLMNVNTSGPSAYACCSLFTVSPVTTTFHRVRSRAGPLKSSKKNPRARVAHGLHRDTVVERCRRGHGHRSGYYQGAPLIVDQPEDDLDNRFITEGVVPIMRREKRRRQFIFSTHNANIPVLGDAELIVGMTATGDAAAIEWSIGAPSTQKKCVPSWEKSWRGAHCIRD